jgi:hypothetical protein
VLEFVKVDGTAVSDYIGDECDICHTEDTTAPDDARVGVGVVHDTESFVETESLVYERLLDTQKATNLFHSVTIFRESGNIEFCVVGDNVLRHRVVGAPVVKGERRNAGSKFGVLLSRQCPRRDFHKIEFRIKMKTAVSLVY